MDIVIIASIVAKNVTIGVTFFTGTMIAKIGSMKSYCNNDFCWICLSVKTNGSWLCGSAFEHCGKIAPVQ